jgi:hypothetical protein
MAVDITKLITSYNRADMQAYINDYTLRDLQYRNFFPGLYTPNLTFEALQADQGAIIAADVVAFDSRAPRKSRKLPTKVTGDIPKIEIAKVKKESDLNSYRMLQAALGQANNPGTQNQIRNRLIDWIYGDSTACLDGVNGRLEWLAKQVASTGKYSLTIANNEGGPTTKVAIDFGIPAGNVTTVGTSWGTVATADVVGDLRAKQDAARANGQILRYAITDMATFNRAVSTTKFQQFAASFANNALGLTQRPNLATANAALTDAGLPAFVIWDSYIQIETKAGTWSAVTGWATNAVLLSPTNVLGNTFNTTTADGFVDIDDAVKSQNDFVLVKAYAEQDPITMVTKGVAYATPVLNAATSLYILNT